MDVVGIMAAYLPVVCVCTAQSIIILIVILIVIDARYKRENCMAKLSTVLSTCRG